MNNSKTNLILYPEDWEDYELLDFGDGKKLERLGKYVFIRPESQAFFPKELPLSKWERLTVFSLLQKMMVMENGVYLNSCLIHGY